MKINAIFYKAGLFLVTGSLLLCGLTGCQPKVNDGSSQAAGDSNVQLANGTTVAIPVRIVTLAPEDLAEYGEYYEEVSGIQEAPLISPLGGRVEKIHVKAGDPVKAGKSLAMIESQAARNQLVTARLNERITREEYDRQQKFLASGNTSQVVVDRAHLAWLSAQSTRLQAEENYEGAFCITPISGHVIALFLKEYELIPPGTLAFIVADLSRLRIAIGVPEADLGGIKAGDGVEIGFAMYPERLWKGTVYSIGQKVTPGSLTFPIEIRMENTDRLLLSGVVATVKIVRALYRGQVIVPLQAVLTEGTSHYVMIVEGEQARRREVAIGFTGEQKMVISSGLSFGDRLIIEGQHIVAEGTRVRVVDRL